MQLPNCIFCGVILTLSSLNQHDSRTREHVYGRWFRDYVVNDKIKMFTSDGQVATFLKQTALNKFWNDSVCGKCNNGWMSVLEQAVDPIINKLTGRTSTGSQPRRSRHWRVGWERQRLFSGPNAASGSCSGVYSSDASSQEHYAASHAFVLFSDLCG